MSTRIHGSQQFNRFGVLGWRFNKLTGHTAIPPWQMRLYSLFLPVAKLVDAIGLGRGLSLIAVAVRSDPSRAR